MIKKSSQGFLILPKLAKHKNLLHGFSTKEFGNMSFAYGKRNEVLTNRENFVKKLVGRKMKIISLRQIHSPKIAVVDQRAINCANPFESIEGDGLITNLKDVCLLIKTADCLPMILYDAKNHVVALLHAGWEGVVGKIFYQAIILMINRFETKLSDLLVGIGPSICQSCYTIEASNLNRSLPEWGKFIKKKRRIYGVDLIGFTVNALRKIGVSQNQLELAQVCTKESKEFFSHRKSREEKSRESRFGTIVCLR